MSPYYLYILQAYTFSNGCTLQGQQVYRVCANICEHITWYNMLILWPSIFVYCTYPKIRWLHNYFVIIIWVAIKLYTIIMLSILKFIAQTWKHAHIHRHTNNGSPSPAACQFGITWYHKPHQAAMTVWSESKPLLLRVLKSMRLLFDNWRSTFGWLEAGRLRCVFTLPGLKWIQTGQNPHERHHHGQHRFQQQWEQPTHNKLLT